MAADYAKMRSDLSLFYDFAGKVVLYVGAAGCQLLDPATHTRKVVAIDKDAGELRALRDNFAKTESLNAVEIIAADFYDVTCQGDVVYFEFCLHEMRDPRAALNHAKHLANDVVIYDHADGSDWSFYCAEEDKVHASSAAIREFGIRRTQSFTGEQRFTDHSELLAKVSSAGALAIGRIKPYVMAKHFAIPMNYVLILV